MFLCDFISVRCGKCKAAYPSLEIIYNEIAVFDGCRRLFKVYGFSSGHGTQCYSVFFRWGGVLKEVYTPGGKVSWHPR